MRDCVKTPMEKICVNEYYWSFRVWIKSILNRWIQFLVYRGKDCQIYGKGIRIGVWWWGASRTVDLLGIVLWDLIRWISCESLWGGGFTNLIYPDRNCKPQDTQYPLDEMIGECLISQCELVQSNSIRKVHDVWMEMPWWGGTPRMEMNYWSTYGNIWSHLWLSWVPFIVGRMVI